MLFSDSLQLVVINRFRFTRNAIVKDFVAETGKVQRVPVRQMSAVRQTHPQNRVAVLNRREIDRHVRLRTAVRLDVCMIGAKQFFRAIDSGLLDDIAPFAAAIVALAGIAFGVLVREH